MEHDNKTGFSSAALEQIEELTRHYPEGKQKSALIPVLHIAQAERGGWLSSGTMTEVAALLKLKPIEVFEVASFYSMFHLEPVGRCVIEVCQTAPCCLAGAEEIIAHLEKKLNIKPGETTPDGMFTLKLVECLAACGHGPVMQVGMEYHENLSIEKIDEIIEKLKKTNHCSHQNPYN